jgi:hypothetical protein
MGRCRATADICAPGATASVKWSFYRDRLSLEQESGVGPYYLLFAKPLVRVP